MSIGSCALVPGVTLEDVYLIWKASCFKVVVARLKGIIDELKLGMDMVPSGLEAAALVVDLMIALNLYKRVPALLVCHGFAEGMEGRGWACEEIIEPGGDGIGSI